MESADRVPVSGRRAAKCLVSPESRKSRELGAANREPRTVFFPNRGSTIHDKAIRAAGRVRKRSAGFRMNGFRKSRDFPKFFALVRPFFDAIEEMRHYEVSFGSRAG